MAAIVLATMTESSRPTLADTFGSGASVGMSPTWTDTDDIALVAWV
jgi:hypothetical protein